MPTTTRRRHGFDPIVRARRPGWQRDGEFRLRAYMIPRLTFPRMVWPTWLWLVGWVVTGSLVGNAVAYPTVMSDGLNPAYTFIAIGYGGALVVSLIQRPWRAKWWPVDGPAAALAPGDIIRGCGRRCWRAAPVAAVHRVGDLVHVTFAPTEPGGPAWPPATFEANAYAGAIIIPIY